MTDSPLRIASHGGGVQSTAMMVLAAQGAIDLQHLVFSDVGADSEHPATMAYLHQHARPYAEAHGLQLHVVQRKARTGGLFPTVRQHVLGPTRDIVIPLRMANGSPGNRKCTSDWKIKVVQTWVREHGATAANPAVVMVGFSTDEWTRANRRTAKPYERVEYPLLDLGLSRTDCERLIADAGLPVPPKSACYFCPFRLPADFVRMATDEPELYAAAVELEAGAIAKRRDLLGKDAVYLTRFGKPLPEVVADAAAAPHQGVLALYAEDEGYRCGDVCDT